MITFGKTIFNLDSAYLWGILAAALIIFAIVSVILRFHWRFYGVEDNRKVFAKTMYWSVSFSLIVVATISLLVFEMGI